MSDVAQFLYGLVIPASIIVIGDLVRGLVNKSSNTKWLHRAFESATIGTSIVVIAFMIAGLLQVLAIVQIVLSAALPALFILWGYRLWRTRRETWGLAHRLNAINTIVLIVFLAYMVRCLLMLATKPIHDGDALYLYIPMGKVFYAEGGIPLFDTYHFWKYTTQPAVSLLYSWSFLLGGSSNAELFRALPLLPFALLPLLVFAISREVFHKESLACLSLTLFCFVPGLDYLLYFYAFYPDVFACLFSGITILYIQRTSGAEHRADMYAGLSLCLAILFKYWIGLFTAVISVFLLFGRSKFSTSTTKFLLAGLFSFILITAGQINYDFLGNPWALFSISLCALCVVISSRGIKHERESEIHLTNILVVAAFASPCLIWGIRALLVGSSMFDIPFLRLSPITLLATSGYSSAASFGPLSLLTPFIHPWFNLFFFPASLMAVLFTVFRNRAKGLPFLFFMYLLFYYAMVGNFMSGRHLLMTILFLLPILAGFLTGVGNYLGKKVQYLLISFYCVSSLLAWTCVSFAIEKIPSIANYVKAIGLVMYSSSYSNDFSLEFFVQKGLLIFITVLILATALVLLEKKPPHMTILELKRLVSKLRFQSLGKKKVKIAVSIISLGVVAAQIGPYLSLALLDTNGNILAFDESGSWNKFDMDVARTLADYVNQSDVVITYGDVILSYRMFRVLDLYHVGLSYFNEVCQGYEGDQLIKVLMEKNFTFCLFPGPEYYLYSSFQKLVASSKSLQDLESNPWLSLIEDFDGVWVLYRLVNPVGAP